ncbi:THUMP-like domain-containing protein [Pelodictyon luteolum]|uniref:THUMP-like domain-containing protein n=1 Tax=Chlorobium luteolum (strain DSM 273 / BCRC 81028 / 2530) TaxID=319225 RepID=Q3B176_CHLL3|nr:class I SAM-dependent methyltransferase [Pelodictyon luteolum]ABB24905.1 conserved hypothetical protein [Pelodictyon luteolum DSM 273]
MTEDELFRLQDPGVLAMVGMHEGEEPAEFAMRLHGRTDLPVRVMAEQIACRKKAAAKLPLLSRSPLLYTARALEQASEERAASYMASLLKGRRAIDLSGGLGIDAFSLAGSFEEVVHVERDPVLSAIACHNMGVLGRRNVECLRGDGRERLASFPDGYFDWIYLDPDRREGAHRNIRLEEGSPDVVSLHDFLLQKAPGVCIKASPALETSRLKDRLPSLASVTVLSVDGQCRATLLILRRQAPLEVERHAVCIRGAGEEARRFTWRDTGERRVSDAVMEWLLEPDPAILKAGLEGVVAETFGLLFINRSVGYLTAAHRPEGFPGRVFRVVEAALYSGKGFGKFLKRHGIDGAAIQRRDFPLSADAIRARYRLKEDDRRFLFFTRDAEARPLAIYAVTPPRECSAVPAGQCRSADPDR